MRISVCATCELGAQGFVARLGAALTEAGIHATVQTTECMSGCARPSTVAFRDDGKTAYLFGDLTDADLPDLLRFATLYDSLEDGVIHDARPLGGLRMKALARIPG